MKRVLKITTVLAFLFVSITGIANETRLRLVSNSPTKSLVFKLDSQSKNTSIKLVDVDNNIIYSESIEGEVYVKRFDLKNLENGLYYFKAEDALKNLVYTIRVADDEVKIIEEKEIFKPIFRRKADAIHLNLLNLSKEDVTVEVFDSNNRLVYSELFQDTMNIEKAINFNKAPKDVYAVVVKNTNNTYYNNVVIK